MNTKITLEQAEEIAKSLDDLVKGTDVEKVQNFPSNNGVETRETEAEEGESRLIKTSINPETGEAQIIHSDNEVDMDKTFDEKVDEKIKNFDDEFDNTAPATNEEFKEVLEDNGTFNSLKVGDISDEDIKIILDITNRRIKKENFNVFKALPESVQKMITNYITEGGNQSLPVADKNAFNFARNSIAELMIDEFKNGILMERAKNDFANELASIYSEGTKDIASESLSLVEDRNKAYREAAEKIEDPGKKERMIAILDQIDEARSLSKLKEFAKTVRIKKIEFEKSESRVYRSFLNKYATSTNNIYDIGLCWKILLRIMSPDYSDANINSFFIAFCKQVQSYDINNPVEHAYIYYVLYYCAMLDGDKSDVFKNNVKEVMDILDERYHDIMK